MLKDEATARDLGLKEAFFCSEKLSLSSRRAGGGEEIENGTEQRDR